MTADTAKVPKVFVKQNKILIQAHPLRGCRTSPFSLFYFENYDVWNFSLEFYFTAFAI